MTDEFEEQEWMKVGVAAALSRQYAADQSAFLESIADLLESALPSDTEVVRKGGFFTRKKAVESVRVTLGEDRLALSDTGRNALQATRTRIVRGIALKTQDIPVEEWVAVVSDSIQEQARANQAARNALARLVG